MGGYAIKVGSTAYPLFFVMISSSDHISGVPGIPATITVWLQQNGATNTTPAGTVYDCGHGIYALVPTASDTGSLGPLWLHAEAPGCDPSDICYLVVAYDPFKSQNLGLSALPTANPGFTGGLLISHDDQDGALISVGTLPGQINLSAGKVPATMTAGDYAGNTPQTGDNFARIGANGAGLTALAPAASALSSATWTNARAANLDALVSGGAGLTALAPAATALSTANWTNTRAANLDRLDVNVSTRSTDAGTDTPGTTSILTMLTGLVVPADHAQFTAHALATAPTGGAATDPWATVLPGTYGSTTAGGILGGNVDAKVSTRSTYAGGAVASVTAPVAVASGTVTSVTNPVSVSGGTVTSVTGPVTVGTVQDKAGYNLAATGLDAIPTTAPAGVAGTFREMMVALWRRYYRRSTKSVQTGEIVTYADDGTTVLSTQAFTDDGTGNEMLGPAQ